MIVHADWKTKDYKISGKTHHTFCFGNITSVVALTLSSLCKKNVCVLMILLVLTYRTVQKLLLGDGWFWGFNCQLKWVPFLRIGQIWLLPSKNWPNLGIPPLPHTINLYFWKWCYLKDILTYEGNAKNIDIKRLHFHILGSQKWVPPLIVVKIVQKLGAPFEKGLNMPSLPKNGPPAVIFEWSPTYS